ncbi:uncharacterized protein BDV17DRAFT_134067 [Aspergillus undulatus]|uniref:uncharacterized protein n=1 Tax=Aspergillus undulatus TaxID=1810928 RepID=UPI003CCD18B9
MSCSIDLGQRLFSSSDSDLSLSLQASALMLLPPETPLSHETGKLKEALCSGDIWVTQKTELKLDIRITSGADLHPSVGPQIVGFVCKAKMWSDLGLAVAYKSIKYEPEQTCHLSFGIRKRCESPEKTSEPRFPKILRDLADSIPPNDVLTARIGVIDVRLKYSHAYEQPLMQFPSQTSHDYSADTSQSTDISSCNWDQAYYSQESLTTVGESDDLLLELDIRETNEGWSDPSHAMLDPRCTSGIGTLFQDALTTLVLGDVIRLRGRKGTNDNLKSLSTIAPSVFKLGYSEAMNQRSRLTTSIAKSLTSMLDRSDNQALKDKLASIQTSHSSNFDTTNPPKNDDHPNTKTILKTRLWTIAQKRLYHAPTPKHLRKFSNIVLNPVNDEHGYEDNLITESISEHTVYPDDDCYSHDSKTLHHSDLCSESINKEPEPEPELISELEFQGIDERSSSIMILGDNNTDPLADMDILGDYIDTSIPKPENPHLPLHFKEEPDPSLTLPYAHTISVPVKPAMPDSDHEMLDFDSCTLEGFEPPYPSARQIYFSTLPHSYHEPFVKSEDEAPSRQDQKSFQHSPHFYHELLMEENGSGDEMLYDDSGA